MAVLVKPVLSLGLSRAFFMHNWRCAGSSLNSLLASNFGSTYLKIGTQFSEFGWPLYEQPELLCLGDVRSKLLDGCVFGGHLCSGVDALLPGNWDIWMNARRPVERLSSGIMRFHSKAFRMAPGTYEREDVRTNAEQILRDLLDGPLRHEVNGIAKRLAGLSIAEGFNVDQETNLETLSCFEDNQSDEQMFDAARKQLDRVRVLIMPDYLHASLICLEKMYGLPPLINPFSDLHHNDVSLGKASRLEREMFSLAKPFLLKKCDVDESLWIHIVNKFKLQLAKFSVSKKDVLVRQILHESPLFNIEWFTGGNITDEQQILCIVQRLLEYSKRYPNLSFEIVKTVCSWSRFDEAAKTQIKNQTLAALSNS